jgi:hypothetical protein
MREALAVEGQMALAEFKTRTVVKNAFNTLTLRFMAGPWALPYYCIILCNGL